MLAGCAIHTTVTNLPPGVTQQQVNNWQNASNDLSKAQSFTHVALVSVTTFNKNGVFPDSPAYAATLENIGRAEQVEIAAAQFLKTVPNDWSMSVKNQIAGYTANILMQLQAANTSGATGVKNLNTAKQLNQLIGNAIQVMQLVQKLSTGAA